MNLSNARRALQQPKLKNDVTLTQAKSVRELRIQKLIKKIKKKIRIREYYILQGK